MKTFEQLLEEGITGKIWLAKRGKKYVTIKNGELALTQFQLSAIAHTDHAALDSMFSAAECDDRNRRFAPKGFVPVNVPA